VYTWDVSGKNKAPAKVYLLCIQRNDNLMKQRVIISR
jgi:hypothetical protein